MKKPMVILGAALFLLVAGGVVMAVAWQLRHREPEPTQQQGDAEQLGSWVEPEDVDKDGLLTQFTLIDQQGERFSSRDLKGKVWVVSFFFATCPGTCRIQNNHVMSLQSEFGPQGAMFVSITCDPETDTPAKLGEYAETFNARPDQWKFLTGDLVYIRRVGGEMFQTLVMKGVHQDLLIVVDKTGEIRGRFNWHDAAALKACRETIEKCLAENPA